MPVQPPICEFGWPALTFALTATDGTPHTLSDIQGERGTLIVFICNHCPYVLASVDRMVRDMGQLMDMGIGCAAICSNDADQYPQDSFENMGRFAREHQFTFPYLHDETQAVARDYGAHCTPDFFGFNNSLELQYRGRLDSNRVNHIDPDAPRELVDAMTMIAETGKGPETQFPSMGCTIKWKA